VAADHEMRRGTGERAGWKRGEDNHFDVDEKQKGIKDVKTKEKELLAHNNKSLRHRIFELHAPVPVLVG
jgi:hypothetical protein